MNLLKPPRRFRSERRYKTARRRGVERLLPRVCFGDMRDANSSAAFLAGELKVAEVSANEQGVPPGVLFACRRCCYTLFMNGGMVDARGKSQTTVHGSERRLGIMKVMLSGEAACWYYTSRCRRYALGAVELNMHRTLEYQVLIRPNVRQKRPTMWVVGRVFLRNKINGERVYLVFACASSTGSVAQNDTTMFWQPCSRDHPGEGRRQLCCVLMKGTSTLAFGRVRCL